MENKKELLVRAVEAGWVYTLDQTPLIVFRPPMTRLITALRGLLIREVAHPFSFEEYVFPRIVPEEVLAKTGWLTHHRHEAWLVDPKQEFVYTPDDDGRFPQRAAFPTSPLPYALDPIQCVSLYYALYDKELDPAQLPIKAFEYQGGWTHRRESSVIDLWRGIEFLRLEFVFIGTGDHARQLRNSLVKKAADTMVDLMGLGVKVAAGDSCFLEASKDDYSADAVLEPARIGELSDLEAIDILFPREGGYLELASAARHPATARRFKIRIKGSADSPWSGCMGIGLTRLVAAFLEKHGFDSTSWQGAPVVKRLFDESLP